MRKQGAEPPEVIQEGTAAAKNVDYLVNMRSSHVA